MYIYENCVYLRVGGNFNAKSEKMTNQKFDIFIYENLKYNFDIEPLNKFLEDNHIQGKLGAKVRVGLYHNEELVSLMTFGSLRKSLGSKSQEGDWELLRFCNKLNTNVVGGASKLLKYFINNYKPDNIISYADRRWSEGNLYYNLGFKLVGETRPNYFYLNTSRRESRFKYRKDILVKQGYDPNKTEREIMKERGYLRIYDCGTLKFEYKSN